jgi:hypothetical protein
VDLFDFRKGAKKIQLIVARESVVDLVLKFHSSSSSKCASRHLGSRCILAVVMNIITHANAFSLYPRATFIENRSIACRETTPPESHKAALSKYEARGWKVVKILPRQELYYVMGVSDRRVFPKRSYSRRSSPNPRTTPHEVNWPVRVIGDDLTWSVSLPPISGQVQGPRLGEMLYSNSWRMRVERMDRIVDMVFEVKHSPWLKYPICKAACSETNDIWRAYEKYYKSVNGRGGP